MQENTRGRDMNKVIKYHYLTINSLIKRLINNDDVFKELERLKVVDFKKMNSIFKKKASNYYGFMIEIDNGTKEYSYSQNLKLEFYNIENCNFILAYHDERFIDCTETQWIGNYPINVTPEFLCSFLLDIEELHTFSSNSTLLYYANHLGLDPFSDDVITTETMMKAKMLSLKYEKDIPVDFWTEVLKEENDYGEFLVENLLKKMKRGE